jgi:signal transduction histidine kinase
LTAAVANEQASALWELTSGEIAGLSLRTLERREVFHRGEQPWRLADVFAGQGSRASDALAAVEVEGIASRRILEVVATPMWLATGDGHVGTVVLFRDVTEARRLEQMREDLTHMLVHDLRTPLSAIYTGVSALLSDEQMDREMVHRVLRLVESNAGGCCAWSRRW